VFVKAFTTVLTEQQIVGNSYFALANKPCKWTREV